VSESTYSFRPGSRVSGVSADVAGRELDRIRRENGGDAPTDIVLDEARPADAPLHPAFTWDNRVAGEMWRRQEAMHLIRAVYVRTEPDGPSEPMFVHVATEDGGAYRSVSEVVHLPDQLDLAIAALEADLRGIRRTIRDLRDAAGRAGNAKWARKAAGIEKHIDRAAKAAGSAKKRAVRRTG
jgi:hypothetical protein